MGLIKTLKRHLAVSGGDFSRIFARIEIPPLPEVAARLLEEFNQPEPDIARLTTIISSDMDISSRVLRTVNSSLYALPSHVNNLQHAITLMGLQNLHKLALSYAVHEGVSQPVDELFNREAFWSDSLLQALLSRSLCEAMDAGDREDAFTISLLSDIAIPVLLGSWPEYYRPVIKAWREGDRRLPEIEGEMLGWDHTQAGAWILESWCFPEQTTTLVAAHNLPLSRLHELGLMRTLALPIQLASRIDSVLRNNPHRSRHLALDLLIHGGLEPDALDALLGDVADQYLDIRSLFGLGDTYGPAPLLHLREAVAASHQGVRG